MSKPDLLIRFRGQSEERDLVNPVAYLALVAKLMGCQRGWGSEGTATQRKTLADRRVSESVHYYEPTSSAAAFGRELTGIVTSAPKHCGH